ncbi:uncharacterized protein LOC126839805 [Adelges cooleyi]|uniref:uncharacterized protein LOC126839805 n=1 Tax=Adelges cooleyi TaxID=133065 RepID=UPI00217F4BDD|nr:uncharacterized protein LOC126839805 [Adelges cooleyi]
MFSKKMSGFNQMDLAIKMKISWFLLSFICVNVLADISIMDYIELVEISNEQLRKASAHKVQIIESQTFIDGLEHVLTDMINTGHCEMKHYNQMFTVPERAQTHNFDLLQDAINTEKYTLQKKLLETIGITAADDKNQSYCQLFVSSK